MSELWLKIVFFAVSANFSFLVLFLFIWLWISFLFRGLSRINFFDLRRYESRWRASHQLILYLESLDVYQPPVSSLIFDEIPHHFWKIDSSVQFHKIYYRSQILGCFSQMFSLNRFDNSWWRRLTFIRLANFHNKPLSLRLALIIVTFLVRNDKTLWIFFLPPNCTANEWIVSITLDVSL